MGRVLYEVCVEDARGALAAQRGGADRVELCQALPEGGTTPSRGALEVARARAGLPVVALIRPRPGDFVYDADELETMERDVRTARELGLAGVALGVLTADGRIDVERTGALVAAARPLDVTLHRAFDHARDLEEALDAALSLGVERVLTSGGAPTAEEGAEVLERLVERAAERLALVAAGGVRPHNVRRLVEATGVREVHGSAPAAAEAPALGVALGSGPGGGSLRRRTDEAVVRAVVEALA
jgi:copper homeostasis protein